MWQHQSIPFLAQIFIKGKLTNLCLKKASFILPTLTLFTYPKKAFWRHWPVKLPFMSIWALLLTKNYEPLWYLSANDANTWLIWIPNFLTLFLSSHYLKVTLDNKSCTGAAPCTLQKSGVKDFEIVCLFSFSLWTCSLVGLFTWIIFCLCFEFLRREANDFSNMLKIPWILTEYSSNFY